jgi:hypothetical protein
VIILAVKYTDHEIEQLATQMTFENVFESLMENYLELSQVEARIERDEQLVLYWMTKQTDSIGAKRDHGQINLDFNGFGLTAKPGSKSAKIDHAKVYAEVDTLKQYYEVMREDNQHLAESTSDKEEAAKYKYQADLWGARCDVVNCVLDIKTKHTTPGGKSEKVSLRFLRTNRMPNQSGLVRVRKRMALKMTNDVVQIEQGIHGLILHVYEVYLQKGFSEAAAKQEAVKVLVREIWNVAGNDAPDVEYIIKPTLSPALSLLSKEVAKAKGEQQKMLQVAYSIIYDIYQRKAEDDLNGEHGAKESKDSGRKA